MARTATAAPSSGEVAAAAACVDTFDAQYDYVYAVLRRFHVREADIEDIAQEVFLVVWRRWREFDQSRPLRPWLAGIAYRVAYNHRAKFSREVLDPWLDAEDPAADPEKGRVEADMRSLVQRALRTINEKQRTVLVLHDMEDVSMRDLAALLGVPLPTVYSRLREGRRQLVTALRRIRAHLPPSDESQLPDQLEELLAKEREPLPPPADRRRKAIARLRALVPMLPSLPQGPRVPLRPRPSLLVTAAVTAAAVGIGGALVFGIARISSPTPSKGGLTPISQPMSPGADQTFAPSARQPASRLVLPAVPASASPAPSTMAAPSLGTGVPETALSREGLVGYWRLDDGAGSGHARDLSGGGNDCTLRGLDRDAAWIEGWRATGIRFGSGWLECSETAALDQAKDAMTIALWVKRSGPVARVRALVTRQLGHGAKDAFHLGFRDGLLILQSSLWPVTLATAYPADDREDNGWHHLAATSGPDRRARLYIDGQLVASKKTGPVGATTELRPLIIGGGSNGPNPTEVNERFDGLIDEVLVYARALSAAEIAALAGGNQPHVSQ